MTTLVQIQVESMFQTRLQKCADLHHADFRATPTDITQDTGTMQVMARQVMEGAGKAPSCLVGNLPDAARAISNTDASGKGGGGLQATWKGN